MIEEAITRALKEAKQKGIFGKEVTPFILSAVAKATGGASLKASILLYIFYKKVGFRHKVLANSYLLVHKSTHEFTNLEAWFLSE